MSVDSQAAASPAPLSGLHLLLTYECNFECDHCFVWGSPHQTGTMTTDTIDRILGEAESLGTIEWIYFEGGEAFLYYPTLLHGIERAGAAGFRVGIVTNAYWADTHKNAIARLEPLAGAIDDLSLSSDAYHGSDAQPSCPEIAREAALELGIPVNTISVAEPNAADADGQLPPGESAVQYRGRAAERLTSRVGEVPWDRLDECPWEDLRHPERVHVDPFGYLHVCQGITIGNLLEQPLTAIMEGFRPDEHPILGPLLTGGPAEIVRRYGLPKAAGYADHCHLCYEARRLLRERFPVELAPDQMYGVAVPRTRPER